MDFFASQDAARKKTGLLVFYFILAVVLIVAALCAALALALSLSGGAFGAEETAPRADPLLFIGVALGTLLVVFSGSLFKIAQLRGGGERVAEGLEGRRIAPGTIDFEEKRLLNVVEEMSLASGLSVPPVYVLDNEKSINAFAAGYTPDDAVLGITRGAVKLLNRDELQGVIAHEYSHILNGDMRLNIRLVGLLHGILLLALTGRILLRGASYSGRSRRQGKGGGAAAILICALALLAVGYIGVFFGKLIKSAVSRQREYLADASAAQFTRNPEGIAGALKKIGGLIQYGSRIRHPRAEEASHMYFGNGMSAKVSGALATHPPLVDRIRRLDPRFTCEFPRVQFPSAPPPVPKQEEEQEGQSRGGLPLARGMRGAITAAAVIAGTSEVLGNVGAPTEEHLEAARALLDAMPPKLRDAARDPFSARALIYLLLLDPKEEVRQQQWQRLGQAADARVVEEARRLEPLREEITPEMRLPLVDLSMAALRGMSEDQYRRFRENVDQLAAADEEIDLFEYALRHVLLRRLEANYTRPRRVTAQIYALRGVAGECSCLLSLLSRVGQPDEESAAKAFEHAVALLRQPGAKYRFLSREESTLGEVDRTLLRLNLVTPKLKKAVIAACLLCITFDQEVGIEEAELFRAIANALECPVPPWLVTANGSGEVGDRE